MVAHIWPYVALFGRNLGLILADIAPYFLFGLLVAGVLKVYLPPESLTKHLGGRGLTSIFKAAALGVPLPLCSCGVLPVAVSLYRHGASLPATLAFLVSTPQTGIDAILVTWGLFGGAFTVAYTLAALLAGLFTGLLAKFFHPQAPKPAGCT